MREAPLRVLLANEPRSYRESIAAVFRQLRPGLQVKVVEPEALESSVTRFDPDVAICSRVTGAVMERVPVWVELYPEHAAHSVASEGAGERSSPRYSCSTLSPSSTAPLAPTGAVPPSPKWLAKTNPFSRCPLAPWSVTCRTWGT